MATENSNSTLEDTWLPPPASKPISTSSKKEANNENDFSWMASTFNNNYKDQEDLTFLFEDADLLLEHDATFAPPNSPSTSPFPLRSFKIPRSQLVEDFEENASPVVSGVLDNTWYSYASNQITIPTPTLVNRESITTSNCTYPYFSFTHHDMTFRDCTATSASLSSNHYLNESTLELLQNSLLDSNRKRKRGGGGVLSPEKGGDMTSESSIWLNFSGQCYQNNDEEEKGAKENGGNKILTPIIEIFLKSKVGDDNQPHILNCIKELLGSGIISAMDLVTPEFLTKAASILRNDQSSDEETLFHVVSLFEKYLLRDIDQEGLKLIKDHCKGPLGKLALKDNEELSSRAEKCLMELGDD